MNKNKAEVLEKLHNKQIRMHKPSQGLPGREKDLLSLLFEGNGLSVDYQQPSWQNWYREFFENTAERLDIVYIPDGWLPAAIRLGKLRPIPEQKEWTACYTRSILEKGMRDSRLFGIPVYGAVWCLLYNADLMEGAGMNQAPRTWRELRKCLQLLQAKYPDIIPYGLSNDSDGHFIDHGWIYLFAGGRSRWDKNGRCMINNQHTEAGLRFLRSMMDQQLMTRPELSSEHIKRLFLDGKIAMTIGPADIVLEHRMQEQGFRLGSSLVPFPEGGRSQSLASVGLYGVSSNSHASEAAVKELLGLLASPKMLQRHATAVGMIPVHKGGSYYRGDECMSVYAKQMEKTSHLPHWPIPYANWVNDHILSFLMGEGEPLTVLNHLSERINEGLLEIGKTSKRV
ncbi:ABC transporter substrate-binding protein [Paenibacillus sp. HB172176]|uniref:ABC transporter substrate-binding protein n=1 Tax=Paenibacillus sp. HB172176 TaxID=2493690 RepID=UPI00143C715E|nr:ABC transporter substrate-binding protein [Paenibacillus sp. HB172176]